MTPYQLCAGHWLWAAFGDAFVPNRIFGFPQARQSML